METKLILNLISSKNANLYLKFEKAKIMVNRNKV